MISKSLSTSRRYAQLYEDAGPLGEFAQALFPLLIAHVDDFGRMSGDTFTVKHLCHPTSPRPLSDFEAALDAMVRVNLIVRSTDNLVQRIQVVQFEEHQVGLHKRTESKFPEIPGNSGGFPLKRTELKGTEGKGSEEKAASGTSAPRQQTSIIGKNVHLTHAFCDHGFAYCVPVSLHHKLASQLAPRFKGDPDLSGQALRDWYPTVTDKLVDGFVMGDAFAFWQRQFDAAFANAPPAAQAGKLTTRLSAAIANIEREAVEANGTKRIQ